MIDSKVGNPYLDGATVVGKVEKHGKQRKIRIFKYTQKSKASRRRQGHRQPYTKVEITSIKLAAKKTATKAAEKVEA